MERGEPSTQRESTNVPADAGRFHTQTCCVPGPTQSPEEAPVPKRSFYQNPRLLLQLGDGTACKDSCPAGKTLRFVNIRPQCEGQ